MKKILILNIFLFASVAMFANAFKCTVKNIHQPKNTDNIIEFDVYLQSTTKQSLKFQAFQGGLNFNYDQLANGGVITGEFVKNSGDSRFEGHQATPNWNVNPSTKQIRLIAGIQTNKSKALVIPVEGIKLGTFRLINSKPFASVKPNFEYSFVSGRDMTKTTVTAFVETKAYGEAIAKQNSFSFENQGPEFYIESNPTINSKPGSAAAAVAANAVSVYPNPASELVKVDISATASENVTISLIDNTGRMVKQIQTDIAVGKNTIPMEIAELSSGNYLVQVNMNSGVITKQFVKQ